MIGALAGLLSGVWIRVAGIAAGAAAIGAAVLAVRKSGVNSQQTADLKQEVSDDAKANAARADTAHLPDGAAVAELHAKWSR